MIQAGFIFLFLYVFLMFYLGLILNKLPEINEKYSLPKIKFSIIIPFKNEADNLPLLLHSLQKINYPKEFFEIIFVNDHSSDSGEQIIKKYGDILPIKTLQNIWNSKSPKKDALETGIQQAKFEYIITTDADCEIPEDWLLSYNHFIVQKSPELIAGPVTYTDKKGFFYKFQSLEFLILQAFTQAGFAVKKAFIANGANLCFTKKSFEEVGGYQGNKHLVSGDDVFLLEKIRKKFPKKIYFLKDRNNVVRTFPVENKQKLIYQKIRWASKMKIKKKSLGFWIGLLILTINLYQIYFLFFLFVFSISSVLFLLIKFLIDFYLIIQTNKFYQNKLKLLHILYSELIYPFYLFSVLLGIINGNFKWKDNKY